MGSANYSKWIKRIIITALACAAALYLILCLVLYQYQEKLIFRAEKLAPDFTFSFSEPFKEIRLEAKGATIHALHFKVENPKGVVLYLHGNGGSLRGWGNVAPQFSKLGYDTFLVDYRGYGKSTGTITNEKDLHEDTALAYRHLKKQYAESQIVLYGRSFGTGLATFLASTPETKPKLLILETPYFNLQEHATARFPIVPSFIMRYPMRLDQWISKVTCPVYLFHGTQDPLIPFQESERLAKLIQSKHELFIIDGGGHNNLSSFKEYPEQLTRILK